ncbi:MAG: ATP-binding protein [Deltaproteobacteria bacterium]|nr:ATP-binding protein [Deltaproteobacteria bacterium]
MTEKSDRTNDKARFSLTHYPLPKSAQGKTFFDKGAGYTRLRRAFRQTIDDRTVGVLSGDPGVGKTSAIRNLIGELARPDHQVLYLCNTSGSPLDLYRAIAGEIGVRPSHRRGQLWTDIKKAVVHMVDERGVVPVIVLDEAQNLSDSFLIDLAGFLNFAFDSRDLMPVWLVGLPPLVKRLHQLQHDALRTRIAVEIRLEALDRQAFGAAVEHAFKAAGATQTLVSEAAVELLFRASRGVLRVASKILRVALRIAGDKNQPFLDEHAFEAAVAELGHAP